MRLTFTQTRGTSFEDSGSLAPPAASCVTFLPGRNKTELWGKEKEASLSVDAEHRNWDEATKKTGS
jgi:hypothetical protein